MSIWSKMGVRDGKFIAVNPLLAMDGFWNFFTDLRASLYKGMGSPYPKDWEWHKNFSFAWRIKRHGNFGYDVFSWIAFATWGDFIGTFIQPEHWCAEPDWVWESFLRTDEDVLQDEVIIHPLSREKWTYAEDMEWQRQRYELIRRLRFMVIPMERWTKARSDYDDYAKWYKESATYVYTSCSKDEDNCYHHDFTPRLGRSEIYGVKFSVPDYWAQEGVEYKIGIVLKGPPQDDSQSIYLPLRGSFWHHGKEYVFETKDHWKGYARFSAFAIVDLSTHPDFAKYYDAEEIVCPSLPGPSGDPAPSPSSSSPSSSEGSSWESSSSATPPHSSSSHTPPPSSSVSGSSSTPPPSSSTTPPSSSGGGGGDDVLEFIGFEVNTLHRNCGVVTPYAEEWIGDDTPDPQHFCYATSWDMPDAESTGRFSTVYLGSVSCDVVMNSCFGWDEAQIEEATLAMRSAQEYINARIPSAPWLRIAPIIGNDFVEVAPGGVDYNKNTGRITIEQWAFTGNAPHGNPCQAFGELTLVNLPAGVSAVWVEVWGKEYKLTIGDVLGWDELRHVFALGELPLTVIGTCGGEDGGPAWPVIQNAENFAYPWGGIGTRQTLEMIVKRWERNNTRTTAVNAYLNALPEDLR